MVLLHAPRVQMDIGRGVLGFHVNGTDTSHTCWLHSQLEVKCLVLSSYFRCNCSSKMKLPPAQESYESTRPYLSDSTTIDCASGSVVFEMLGSKVFAISHDPHRDFPEVAACGWTITRVVSAYHAGGLSGPVKKDFAATNDMQGGSRVVRTIVSCAQPPHHSFILHGKPCERMGMKS